MAKFVIEKLLALKQLSLETLVERLIFYGCAEYVKTSPF